MNRIGHQDLDHIRRHLENWDGKHIQYLVEFYDKHIERSNFLDEQISLLIEESLQVPTSWLLKHHQDLKKEFSKAQTDQIIQSLPLMTHWESRLHLLQMIPHFQINIKQAKTIQPTVKNLLKSEKKFVKAAAFLAYSKITEHFPEYKKEFRNQCEYAMKIESASVKSKIRKILKKLDE